MAKQLTAIDKQHMIAKRVAQELHGPCTVNLGIGIPTLVAEYIEDKEIFFHTENGMLGVTDVAEENIDPNLVNAGKLPVGESVGASYFHSADSFAMIRGEHIDVAILGALQVDEKGRIANWAVPGKTIIGVGGAMDLLVGARKVIVTMNHFAKNGASKLLRECTYPITSTRSVDMIMTDMAVFNVIDQTLVLKELMPGVTINELKEMTEAHFIA